MCRNIGVYMDNRVRALTALILFMFTGLTVAGYAQVSPPVNWTEAAGKHYYRAASNDVSFTNGIRGSAGVLNVGGQAVKMPAAYRFAPNAARYAATFAFGNPAVFLAMGAAGLAYKWYLDNDFSVDPVALQWRKRQDGTECLSNCFEYRTQKSQGAYTAWLLTPQLVAEAVLADAKVVHSGPGLPSTAFIQWNSATSFSINYYPYGSLSTLFTRLVATQSVAPYNTIRYAPVTVEDFQTQMDPKPIPHGVPQVFPSPLPVELPIINPTPQRVPYAPGDPSPTRQPVRVPQGEPQPVPDTNPQRWRQPAIDIVPSPNLDTPWRVDVQPRDIVSDSPTPLPDSAPVPQTPASGTTSTSTTPDLCEKNPDILACQKVKLEVPDPDDITNRDKEVTFNKNSGWGGGGSCPAPRQLTSVNVSFNVNQICDFMTGVRPVALAIAWLIGGLILIGARGGSSD